MMRRWFWLGGLAVIAGLAVFWIVTTPRPLVAAALPANYKADAKNGELLFAAGGCAS